ncbi:hypothetical protein TEA_001637 [Camellia sinensis var. sinensis]|uniref:TNase-like domain-containing protein n=1 Tax=Camellia sinensis var. sinensis TaxID=542762 RepID=A0A4S4EP44_CAMSN|nr:hypothetical protein TEA_001637 [Camellia sinensis var. sinensis]
MLKPTFGHSNGSAKIKVVARAQNLSLEQRSSCYHWSAIRAIRSAVRIPVLANGNIRHNDDAQNCLKETGADRVGCPQHIAWRGNYGAFLMDNLPLIKCLNAGCSLLAIHGHTRDEKDGKKFRADWSAIRAVKSAVKIPVLANGNIRHVDNAQNCLKETGVDGVLTAESFLGNPAHKGGVDEPFAWESKEYLRKLCMGKDVTFKVDYTVPSIGREFGSIFLSDENVALMVIFKGWVKVGEQGQQKGDASPFLKELLRLEEQAIQQGLGHWTRAVQEICSLGSCRLWCPYEACCSAARLGARRIEAQQLRLYRYQASRIEPGARLRRDLIKAREAQGDRLGATQCSSRRSDLTAQITFRMDRSTSQVLDQLRRLEFNFDRLRSASQIDSLPFSFFFDRLRSASTDSLLVKLTDTEQIKRSCQRVYEQ